MDGKTGHATRWSKSTLTGHDSSPPKSSVHTVAGLLQSKTPKARKSGSSTHGSAATHGNGLPVTIDVDFDNILIHHVQVLLKSLAFSPRIRVILRVHRVDISPSKQETVRQRASRKTHRGMNHPLRSVLYLYQGAIHAFS